MNDVLKRLGELCDQSYTKVYICYYTNNKRKKIFVKGYVDNGVLLANLASYGNEGNITKFLTRLYDSERYVFRYYTFELEDDYLRFYYKGNFVGELLTFYEVEDIINSLINVTSVRKEFLKFNGDVRKVCIYKSFVSHDNRIFYDRYEVHKWRRGKYIFKDYEARHPRSLYYRLSLPIF